MDSQPHSTDAPLGRQAHYAPLPRYTAYVALRSQNARNPADYWEELGSHELAGAPPPPPSL